MRTILLISVLFYVVLPTRRNIKPRCPRFLVALRRMTSSVREHTRRTKNPSSFGMWHRTKHATAIRSTWRQQGSEIWLAGGPVEGSARHPREQQDSPLVGSPVLEI